MPTPVSACVRFDLTLADPQSNMHLFVSPALPGTMTLYTHNTDGIGINPGSPDVINQIYATPEDAMAVEVAPLINSALVDINFNTGTDYEWDNTFSMVPFDVGVALALKADVTALDAKADIPGITLTTNGSTAEATINERLGRVNIGQGETSLKVNNSLVTADTPVFAQVVGNDTDCFSVQAVSHSGYFMLYPNPVPGDDVAVAFHVPQSA